MKHSLAKKFRVLLIERYIYIYIHMTKFIIIIVIVVIIIIMCLGNTNLI